jgi:3-hydroxymyristoyl/3-hydroxydecanoyl-(acyl carrier protein) dehydratase
MFLPSVHASRNFMDRKRPMTLRYDGRYTAAFTIPLEHPAIPGHFPGHPVVPGVLILEEVRKIAAGWLGYEMGIRRLPQVKFLAPLLPGDLAIVELARTGAVVDFVVKRGTETIAKGSFELGAAAAS